ncbi:MAG: glycosyl transferase family 36, partial [Chloroflexota bacterium]
RALDLALTRFGAHGLPLMGTGDWNDGMNFVGAGSKGESVWVGWFLYANLVAFAKIAEQRGDQLHAQQYCERAAQLQRALDEQAWDGAWYRRAYFDDGTPLGSAQNDECQIDSIAQSWAVISQAAPAERAQQAMQSVEKYLIDEPHALIHLLAPPFDQGVLEPGYIKGYVPGIRENGGQYTHAALWMVLAYAMQGNGERATQLFALLNPINHALTPEAVARYKVEPYVVAADVYSHPQHVGRGGWTWYTGSAGWMYRIGVESILGLKRRGNTLLIEPCIAPAWKQYQITFRHGATMYALTIENPHGVSSGVARVEVDGVEQTSPAVVIAHDGQTHRVRVILGKGLGDNA